MPALNGVLDDPSAGDHSTPLAVSVNVPGAAGLGVPREKAQGISRRGAATWAAIYDLPVASNPAISDTFPTGIPAN